MASPLDVWHDQNVTPTLPGWYEVRTDDGRFDGRTVYRGWGNGAWWIPLADGWLTANEHAYHWRGPVADIDGPAPDGTDPR